MAIRTGKADARGVIASALLISGGLLKIPLWLLFISLHGPTSFNEEGTFAGGDPLIWGAVMSGVPSLLVAAGLIGHANILGTPTLRRVGLIAVLVALVVPAAVDLSTRALWPPLLIPVLGLGAIVIAITRRRQPLLGRVEVVALVVIGATLVAVFAYGLLIPTEVFDAIDGYRIQGIFEHLLVGLGWVAVGIGLLRTSARHAPAAPIP